MFTHVSAVWLNETCQTRPVQMLCKDDNAESSQQTFYIPTGMPASKCVCVCVCVRVCG